MVKDIRYIIKRVIIGILISLVLFFLRDKLFISAKALTNEIPLYSTTVCGTGYGCSTSSQTPNKNSYANSITASFGSYGNVTMENGSSYNVTATLYINAQNMSSLAYTDISMRFHSATSSTWYTATPDRNVSFSQRVLYQGNYDAIYKITYNFQIDVTSNMDMYEFSFNYTSSYGPNFTQGGYDGGSLLISPVGSNGGSSSDTQDIINNQSNNTQIITNNQNDNTQIITNNQDDNTQDLIDNQNQNTQKEIDSQKVCNFIDKNSISDTGHLLGTNGSIGNHSAYGITDYLRITSNSTIKVLSRYGSSAQAACFYNINKSLISCIPLSDMVINQNLSIPANSSYFRSTISINSNLPTFELCTDGNQALQDSLTDDSGVSNKDLEDFFGDLQENNSPVSDLLTLPITLLQAYLSGFDSSCTTYNLGSLYGTNLTLPCIDIPRYIGNSLWSIIDALCCIYMIYNIAMLFVSIYEQFTSLDDSFQLLYSPRHTGHTRVSRNEGDY